MVNPLRRPVVLLCILAGLSLFVHQARQRKGDLNSQEEVALPRGALKLRREKESFHPAGVRTQIAIHGDPETAVPVVDNSHSTSAVDDAANEQTDLAESSGAVREQSSEDRFRDGSAPADSSVRAAPKPDRSPDISPRATISGDRARMTHFAIAPRRAVARQVRHRVADGDSLRMLAAKYLGDEARYLEIFAANRQVLAHPDLLPLGVTLDIPAGDQPATHSP